MGRNHMHSSPNVAITCLVAFGAVPPILAVALDPHPLGTPFDLTANGVWLTTAGPPHHTNAIAAAR